MQGRHLLNINYSLLIVPPTVQYPEEVNRTYVFCPSGDGIHLGMARCKVEVEIEV